MKKLIIAILLCFCVGCGSKTVLYPITPDDIFSIPKGAEVETADDLFFVEKDGWFISDFYLNEIMDTKVNE